MGGGEILKKGWLVKSPPLEGGGMKVSQKSTYIVFWELSNSNVVELCKLNLGFYPNNLQCYYIKYNYYLLPVECIDLFRCGGPLFMNRGRKAREGGF